MNTLRKLTLEWWTVSLTPGVFPMVSSITYKSDELRLQTSPLLLFNIPRINRLNRRVSRPFFTCENTSVASGYYIYIGRLFTVLYFSVRSSRSSALRLIRAAILHECQNYLGDGGGLGGSEKNRGTVITSLQLAFRRRDRNFTPFTIH